MDLGRGALSLNVVRECVSQGPKKFSAARGWMKFGPRDFSRGMALAKQGWARKCRAAQGAPAQGASAQGLGKTRSGRAPSVSGAGENGSSMNT